MFWREETRIPSYRVAFIASLLVRSWFSRFLYNIQSCPSIRMTNGRTCKMLLQYRTLRNCVVLTHDKHV